MKKIFYLHSCSTCQRILSEIDLSGCILREIKSEPITPNELDYMKEHLGSYELLFNKRALKFRDSKVKRKIKKDDDYRALILEEYTFLKRPAFIIGELAFAGNDTHTIAKVKAELNG